MRQVKGSMFLIFAKVINADKKGTYDKYLTDQDKAVLSKLVLPSNWYPFETYKNCFLAVSQVVVNNNPEKLKDWGRDFAESTLTTIYKSLLLKKDAQSALDAYKLQLKNQFNFGKVDSEMVSENEMIITIEDFDNTFEPWFHVAIGWLERLIQLVIKKPVRSEFLKRSWQGGPATVFKMNW